MPEMPDTWREHGDRVAETARLDADTIDYLARHALAADWTVARQGRTYMRATKHNGERTVQVSTRCKDGKLTATRTEIVDVTNASDEVVSWLEGGS